MTTISFREDLIGRRWRAHSLAKQVRRRWLWGVGGIAAFCGSLAFYRIKLLSVILFLTALPGIVLIGWFLSYPLIRWIPQRWILTDKRIEGRGGWEIGAVRWSEIAMWSIAPIDVLPGYAWLGWVTSARRNNGMVLSPTAPRKDIEDAFRERVPEKEQLPVKSVT